MADYAKIKQIRTGLFVVVGVATVTKVIDNGRYIDLTGIIPTPAVGWYYTESEGFSESIPASVTASMRYLGPVDFYLGRLTDDERGKVFALIENDGGGITLTIIQRGRLKAFIMLTTTNQVPLDHKETVFIINALETVGAIDPGRAAEILA